MPLPSVTVSSAGPSPDWQTMPDSTIHYHPSQKFSWMEQTIITRKHTTPMRNKLVTFNGLVPLVVADNAQRDAACWLDEEYAKLYTLALRGYYDLPGLEFVVAPLIGDNKVAISMVIEPGRHIGGVLRIDHQPFLSKEVEV